jgi:anti-anti-sigma factor
MGKNKNNQIKKSVRSGKDLVASKAESLNKKLYKMIDQGITELTLDFVNVKSVDTVGLSVIAATHNTMNNAGGKLLLKNVPDEINTLFDALGLNKHFEIEQMEKNA